ncbi:MAG: 2-oxoacid:ferredoxin oxidoreductase subunit beta, partial [Xanthomonadales bacterium]|nr:2-oxoacid:ferredoxin oxidoreductase subunit beta [Gammaproteobacteria bacterium]NNK03202.1 2-oxoacid:ferredoxin oxidoreductase subunit beta [Xanthomonadales bacterium]
MSFIKKPKIDLPGQLANKIGLLKRDYEGVLSTLCAGCGHDSITAAIVQAFWELSIPPEQVIKLSGIGCSSKTPAYFLSGAHGFNSVHGRMPSVATGAQAGNRDLICIGVSGDGDSLSIGFGQFGHAVRRNLNMLYIIENNGVYGLTKGQFSAAADKGSKSKRGDINQWKNIDAVSTAISMGSSFVARSFSGDREQLVTLIKAGIMHPGCAILDVVSPCVTFNNHVGSTKSYTYTRDHYHPAGQTDFIPP